MTKVTIQNDVRPHKNCGLGPTRRLHKSNKWDAASDVLKVEARQWALRKSEREKRPYNKSNTEYWEKDLLEARSKKRKTTFDPEEPE